MKILLLLLNIFLFGGVVFSLFNRAGHVRSGEDEYFLPEKVRPKTASAPVAPKKKSSAPKMTSAEMSAQIVRYNIFDTARCPNARVFGRGRNNAKLEMTLVGTFTIGEFSGALILQKQQTSTNANAFPWMSGPPMMNGGPGMMPNAGNGGPDSSADAQQGGSFRRRFGPSFPMMMPNAAAGNDAKTDSSATETPIYKQYVRVGETLANGYKLTAVTRTTATLYKGSDKLELAIVEASKNAGAAKTAAAAASNANGNNFSPDQMRQWMEQMRSMRMDGPMGGGPMGGGPMGGGQNQDFSGGNRNGGTRFGGTRNNMDSNSSRSSRSGGRSGRQ